MSKLGLVEVVRHLPPAPGILANTALQLRCWTGFDKGCHHVHAFAVDDPLAATLEPGQWVEFRKSARAKNFSALELAYSCEDFASVTQERESRRQVTAISQLLQNRGLAAKTYENRHAQAYAVYRKLSLLVAGFGVRHFPKSLLLSCFEPNIARKLQAD